MINLGVVRMRDRISKRISSVRPCGCCGLTGDPVCCCGLTGDPVCCCGLTGDPVRWWEVHAFNHFYRIQEADKINKTCTLKEKDSPCMFVQYDKHACSCEDDIASCEYKIESLVKKDCLSSIACILSNLKCVHRQFRMLAILFQFTKLTNLPSHICKDV